ncbi:MAG: hypothetical protein QOD25_2996 [Alphaproteobacteria bacterium]|jgi:hypothetical protein|nr:hypothetical protein [Alphaproteobacteria bacterium]
MNSLAKLAIDAHGGMARWKQFQTVSADLVQGGVLWHVKGQAGTLDKTNVTVGLRSEWATHSPFGKAGRLLALPGVTSEEPPPWKENGEGWRRLV